MVLNNLIRDIKYNVSHKMSNSETHAPDQLIPVSVNDHPILGADR